MAPRRRGVNSTHQFDGRTVAGRQHPQRREAESVLWGPPVPLRVGPTLGESAKSAGAMGFRVRDHGLHGHGVPFAPVPNDRWDIRSGRPRSPRLEPWACVPSPAAPRSGTAAFPARPGGERSPTLPRSGNLVRSVPAETPEGWRQRSRSIQRGTVLLPPPIRAPNARPPFVRTVRPPPPITDRPERPDGLRGEPAPNPGPRLPKPTPPRDRSSRVLRPNCLASGAAPKENGSFPAAPPERTPGRIRRSSAPARGRPPR